VFFLESQVLVVLGGLAPLSQEKARGKVKRKLTSPTRVSGQNINASEADPRHLVESEMTRSYLALLTS
jgi:Hypervirulence associated proteins TUDOR domain